MAANRLTFRLATDADAQQLEHLVNTAFNADTTTEVFLLANRDPVTITDAAGIRAKIAQPDCAVFAGFDADGALAAHCSVRKMDGLRAWFGLLAVDARRQGHGLGSQVLAWAEQHARQEWGCTRLEFDVVNTRAGLKAWYAHRGYRPTGETRPFPYEYHDNWEGVLRDNMHFVILGKDLVETPAVTTGAA